MDVYSKTKFMFGNKGTIVIAANYVQVWLQFNSKFGHKLNVSVVTDSL